ncbi:molybdate ABC transporter substrate-binding protein [Leucobacter sp. 1207-22]|uniref:molybdate ABC transporter substrate-binding protein n=1 Tax=Leucobacter sp. 1207-22 TaxID=2604456 RepID=UPI0040638FD4
MTQRRFITRGLRRSLTIAAALTITVGSLTACANNDQATDKPAPEASETLSGELNVAAAASLQPAFEELSDRFTTEHPDVKITLSFDGSSVLATQILEGAPIDVFASADEANMLKVTDKKLTATDPITFATSSLEIAVAPGNPLGITDLASLAQPTASGETPVVVLCAAEVPCGAASHKLLDRDGVAITPASEEQSVTAVLTKVAAGEADAGLIYRSDVLRSEGGVDGIEIAGSNEAAGSYLIAPLSGSASPEAALAFAELMNSTEAQQLFEKLGFGPAA